MSGCYVIQRAAGFGDRHHLRDLLEGFLICVKVSSGPFSFHYEPEAARERGAAAERDVKLLHYRDFPCRLNCETVSVSKEVAMGSFGHCVSYVCGAHTRQFYFLFSELLPRRLMTRVKFDSGSR